MYKGYKFIHTPYKVNKLHSCTSVVSLATQNTTDSPISKMPVQWPHQHPLPYQAPGALQSVHTQQFGVIRRKSTPAWRDRDTCVPLMPDCPGW